MLPTALRIFSRTGEQKEGSDAFPAPAPRKSALTGSYPSSSDVRLLLPLPILSSGSQKAAPSPTSQRRLPSQTRMSLPSHSLRFPSAYPPVSENREGQPGLALQPYGQAGTSSITACWPTCVPRQRTTPWLVKRH